MYNLRKNWGSVMIIETDGIYCNLCNPDYRTPTTEEEFASFAAAYKIKAQIFMQERALTGDSKDLDWERKYFCMRTAADSVNLRIWILNEKSKFKNYSNEAIREFPG